MGVSAVETYEQVDDRLLVEGYWKYSEESSGTRYYVADTQPFVRVSDHEPNEETAKLILENNIQHIRVAAVSPVEPVTESVKGYYQHPAFSRSQLETIINPSEGPRFFEAKYLTRSMEDDAVTKPMMIGSLTHRQVLEPHLDDGVIIIPPEVLNASGNRMGKKWSEFEKANTGKALLKQAEYDKGVGAVVAIRERLGSFINSPYASREVEVYWRDEETELPLRVKLDILIEEPGKVPLVPDLKTTADLSRFATQVRSGNLWLQHAMYSEAVRIKNGCDPVFWFVAVRSSPLHRVAFFEIDGDAMEEAEKRFRELLRDVRRRLDESDWADEYEKYPIVLSKRDVFGWKD